MPSEPPALVLFDLDGTLADTFPDLQWALARAMDEHDLAAPDAAAVRAQVTGGARAMVEAALSGCAADVDAEAVRHRFLELYEAHIAARTRLYPGMPAVLDALEHSGAALGVVTNKVARFTDPLLDALQMRPRLRCVVSGDTAARPKPHPDPLLHAARVAGETPGRCLYVGDAEKDVHAARAAGMPIAVAAWGYLGPGDDPYRWRPDRVLQQPRDLLDWLGL